MRKLLLVVVLLALPLCAQKKSKKPVMPEQILRAQTVAVLDYSPGVSVANPGEDRAARDAVKQALTNWGRYEVVFPDQDPDLFIILRKGGTARIRIQGTGTGDSPATSDTIAGIKIGGPPGAPVDAGPPHPGVDSGPAEDMLMVYLGHRDLDVKNLPPPLWRYAGRNALNPPRVRAVEELRKAIAAAEKTGP